MISLRNGPVHHVVRAPFVKPVLAIKDEMKILEKLIILGADVNAKSVPGESPLHILVSIKLNDMDTMAMVRPLAEKLLENGADVNLMNRLGITVLQLALVKSSASTSPSSRFKLAKSLLDHGADPDIVDNYGGSARIFS